MLLYIFYAGVALDLILYICMFVQLLILISPTQKDPTIGGSPVDTEIKFNGAL